MVKSRVVFRYFTLLVLTVLVGNLQLPLIYAAPSLDEINSLSTPFYDPNSQDTCGTGALSVVSSLRGKDNVSNIYNYFIDSGFKDFQAEGILANIKTESAGTFDPTIVQGNPPTHAPEITVDGVTGYGIAQWTFPKERQQGLVDLGKKEGKSTSDLLLQLNYIWQELHSNESKAYKDIQASTNYNDAVAAWMLNYERPADQSKSAIDGRAAGFLALLNQSYGGSLANLSAGNTNGPSAVATSTSGNCATGIGGGNAVVLAESYAWPDGRKGLEMKPNYAAAIAKAQANGEYVGGNGNPGVDCGGFITRVMRDSGADPNYNWGPNNPREGNTIAQKAYMDANPDKYRLIDNVTSTAQLQPGDIAINSTHTYMFTGAQTSSFKGDSAAASLNDYAPTANYAYNFSSFSWYRLVK